MIKVNEKRKLYREQIRQQQLKNDFEHCRAKMLRPMHPDAKQTLEICLGKVKDVASGKRSEDRLQILMQFKALAQSYVIVETLLTSVTFDRKLARVIKGQLPVECSWIELFSHLLQIENAYKAQEELLAIMSLITYQLRISIHLNQQKIIEALGFIIYNIPWHYSKFRVGLAGQAGQIHFRLCKWLGELLTCAEGLGIERQILGKEVNLLTILLLLYENMIFSEQEVRNLFVEVGIMSLSMLKRSQIYPPNMEPCKDSIRHILFENMIHDCVHKQKNYDYIKSFVEAGGVLRSQQFFILEAFSEEALAQKQPNYFQMYACIQNVYELKLRPRFFTDILSFLFIVQANEDKEVFLIKKHVLQIVDKHSYLQERQWTASDLQIFGEIWSNNVSKLYPITNQIKKYSRQLHMQLLILVESVVAQFCQPDQQISSLSSQLVNGNWFVDMLQLSSPSSILPG